MSGSKKYGLILPEKGKQPTFQASHNVFGNDDDSDEDSSKRPVLLRPSGNINRQSKVTQEKALSEDPTVYQYDEIYDSMTSKKEEKKTKSKEEKKPRYIENLLKTANKRKIENERRIERQIHKEREKEGDEFADKEVFVTSAYKKKLEEMEKEEERERREEYLENIGDVTKQKDLGGFYRHLYEQKLGVDKKDENKVVENAETNIPVKDVEVFEKKEKKDVEMRKRNYRKRKSSSDINNKLSEGEIEDSDDEINHLNLKDIKLARKHKKTDENIDADSDFSIDESSDEENTDQKKETGKVNIINEDQDITTKQIDKEVIVSESKEIKDEKDNKDKPVLNKVDENEEPKKIDIWKKRTVGEVFQLALKRYYERKSTRGF